MARIVELTHPDNVTLVQGAVQNWVDLDSPGATSPLLHDLVASVLAGSVERCLVVGPHDPSLLARLGEGVDDLTVVVRSIPDAARIGTALPRATVLCGTVEAACADRETYDLVVALDDITRTLSLEDDQHRTWRELADAVVARLAPGGTLLLGIENELGLHRTGAPLDPRMRDDDANWSPLATWDATRPRTGDQVEDFRAGTGLPGPVRRLYPTWEAPTVLAAGIDTAPRPLRDLLPALAGGAGDGAAGTGALLPARALAMAGSYPEACAGWVLVLGADQGEVEAVVLHASAVGSARWTALDDERVRRQVAGSPDLVTTVPPHGRTVLLDLVEAAADSDTPRMRRLLAAWRESLEAAAVDGVLPAAVADARFGNLLSDLTPLAPAATPAPLQEAAWTALGDLFTTWRSHGIRHPWPSNMHPRTVFEALVAMAGLPAPEAPARWARLDDPQAYQGRQSRQELMAVIERQAEELRGAWSRFHWDEQRYFTYKASKAAKRTVRKLRREGPRKVLAQLRGLLRS